MIYAENVIINGRDFTRTYSDAGRYVVREGVAYSEAYDPAEYGRTYTEGDYMTDGDTAELTAAEIVAAIEEAMS